MLTEEQDAIERDADNAGVSGDTNDAAAADDAVIPADILALEKEAEEEEEQRLMDEKAAEVKHQVDDAIKVLAEKEKKAQKEANRKKAEKAKAFEEKMEKRRADAVSAIKLLRQNRKISARELQQAQELLKVHAPDAAEKDADPKMFDFPKRTKKSPKMTKKDAAPATKPAAAPTKKSTTQSNRHGCLGSDGGRDDAIGAYPGEHSSSFIDIVFLRRKSYSGAESRLSTDQTHARSRIKEASTPA